jgi:hypothetical protein
MGSAKSRFLESHGKSQSEGHRRSRPNAESLKAKNLEADKLDRKSSESEGAELANPELSRSDSQAMSQFEMTVRF